MIGQTLSHYRIEEELGEGGMGQVFRGQDSRLLRSVAVKVLSSARPITEGHRRQLLREARAVSALDHPAIVTLYDIAHDRGIDFLVMEYVAGKPLAEKIPAGGLPWESAARYALEIAGAMAAAHGAGVIHRDLKPQNLMVTEADRIKILDFGIAKLDQQPGDGRVANTVGTSLSDRGQTPGTLAYMSPEQILGEPIDARSDIFALGVVLFEMLTGKRPFHGTNEAHQIHQILNEPAPVIRSSADGIPAEISSLVARCLEKKRGRRPQSMAELETELRRILDVRDPRSDPGRVARLSRRRAWKIPLWVAAGALVLGLVAVSISTVLPWKDLPGAFFGKARDSTVFTVSKRGWDALERFDRTGNIDHAIEEFQRALRIDGNSAAAHAGLAKAYWRKYDRESRDRQWLEQAFSVARRAVELDSDLALARISLALVLTARGEPSRALKELETAVVLDPLSADAHLARTRAYLALGENKAALEACQEAARLGKDDRELHDLQGSIHYRAGNYQAAAEAFERSVHLSPDNPIGYRNLSAAYLKLDRVAESSSVLQKAIEIQPTADLYTNLGTLLFFQGLYPQAAAAMEKAVAFPNGANAYILWGNLGDAYRFVPDREDKSRSAYQRAIQLLQRRLETEADDFEHRSRLGLFLAKRGETSQALTEIDRLGEAAWDDPAVLYRVTLVYELAGDRSRALETLARALANGYPLSEVERDPELLDLRADLAYHQMMAESVWVSEDSPP